MAPFVPPETLYGKPIEEALAGLSTEQRMTDVLNILSLTREDLVPYPRMTWDQTDLVNRELYRNDARYVAETFAEIDGKNQKRVPFILNPIQLHYLFNHTRRDIVLKSRQHGITAIKLFELLLDTMNNQATVSVVLAHEKQFAEIFLRRIRVFYQSLPPDLRVPMTKGERGGDIIEFGSIGSAIHVMAAKDAAGRSLTCNNLLLSEFAFMKVSEKDLRGLLESVPEPDPITGYPGGIVLIESTPDGVGNLYHRLCKQNRDDGELASYKFFQYNWFLNPEYTEAWKRRKQRRMLFHTEEGNLTWQQEYGCSFIHSTRNYFEPSLWKPNSPYIVLRTSDPLGNLYPRWVEIYREPEPGNGYVIGADVAEGLPHGDYSDATVLERETGIEVAHVRTQLSTRDYAEILNWLGLKFGTALLGVEAGKYGDTVIDRLLYEFDYPNLFYYYHLDPAIRAKQAPKLGWHTNTGTRPRILDEFKAARRDAEDGSIGGLYLAYKRRETEMEGFIIDDRGKPKASLNYTDDAVMSGAIANFLRRYPDMMVGSDGAFECGVTVL